MNCIAAVDRAWAIGRDGKLLVRIPADQRYFKQKTLGNVVIMGRKTFESLPKKQPLEDRTNIVISSDPDYRVPGALVVHSAEEAVRAASQYDPSEVFVIGGGRVYRELIPYCDTAYITKIDYTYDADTFFPDLSSDPAWYLEEQGEEQTYFDLVYEFDVYKRV